MPTNYEASDKPFKIPEGLIQAAKLHKLVPLIGTGISKHAVLPSGAEFPDWNKLLQSMAYEAHRRKRLNESEYEQIINKDNGLLKQGKLLMIAQTLCELLDERFHRFVQNLFDPSNVQAGSIHTAILRLKTPLIITTNYDRLLEHAFQSVHPGGPTVYKHKDAELVQRKLQNWKESDPPIIFKIHGCVTDLESIILSENDYRKLYFTEPGYQIIMSSIITSHTILMMGFSFDDPDIRRFLAVLRESLRYSSQPHYILLPDNVISEIEIIRNLQDYNLETIIYKASDEHLEILEFVETLLTLLKIEIPIDELVTAPKSARITRKYINRDEQRVARILP